MTAPERNRQPALSPSNGPALSPSKGPALNQSNGPALSLSKGPALVLPLATLLTGALLFAVSAAMVIRSRAELRAEIHRRIIERDAAVLYPFAMQQVADSAGAAANPRSPLTGLLRSARQEGMIAIAIFNSEGATIEAVPADQLFVELPVEDHVRLQAGGTISRYHPEFPLDQYFAGVAPDQPRVPVLEVLLPVRPGPAAAVLGFVRYTIDARPLARELAAIDTRIGHQTMGTLAVGGLLVGLVTAAAAYGLHRAQRAIAERNERLTRAHFELTLAAKASALGQITSHLIHGLQGPVAGLRNAMTGQTGADWETAAGYTERLQEMIQETVALLRDIGANASYELSGAELAAAIRERNRAAAAERGVGFVVDTGFSGTLDSHRGGLLCLIASNLVQNAIAATPAGRRVAVTLERTPTALVLQVADEGSGIPDAQRAHLFPPGRSGRAGGSGLGLAISQLLARQIGAELALVSTGATGTTFRVSLPLAG